MREQACKEAAVVWAYAVGFNNCDRFVVTEPSGNTCADEVTWPRSVYRASTLPFSPFAEMKMHFESAFDSCSIAES